MIGAIKKRRINKVDGVVNKIRRIEKRNQLSQELNKPTANNSQDTIETGTTEAGTTASNDANLKAGETQWANTRQWDKSGRITDATI